MGGGGRGRSGREGEEAREWEGVEGRRGAAREGERRGRSGRRFDRWERGAHILDLLVVGLEHQVGAHALPKLTLGNDSLHREGSDVRRLG